MNIGQTVVASLNAPSLFLIAQDLTRMQVWASVNEADIGNIHPNQNVTFTVDAFPYRKFKGTVGKVRLNATMTQNVVTYTVEIVADNSDETLLPYLTANVSFEVAQRNDILVVPNAALRWSPTDTNWIAPDARADAGGSGGGGMIGGGGQRWPRSARRGRIAHIGPNHRPVRASPVAASEAGRAWHPAGSNAASSGSSTARWSARSTSVLGVTDGLNTEVISDQLKEDQQVVTGEAVAGAAGSDDARNPFAPQFRRGPGGGGGGRRG